MSSINHAAAIKRLEALFTEIKLNNNNEKLKPAKSVPKIPDIVVTVESKHDRKCSVHGTNGKRLSQISNRRGSVGNILHLTNRRDSLGNIISQRRESYGARRESMPALNQIGTRRNSLSIPPSPPNKQLEHPSGFAATLRREGSASTTSLRKDAYSIPLHEVIPPPPKSPSRRGSTCSIHSNRRDSIGSHRFLDARKFSCDSLDSSNNNKRNSWYDRKSPSLNESDDSGHWESSSTQVRNIV